MRHAKSSWIDNSLTDFERPLNERGRKDAPKMAHSIALKGITPNAIYSSPANRALFTARLVCQTLNFPLNQIRLADEIYDADLDTALDFIKNLPDEHNSVFIFGHNPAFTELINHLSDNIIHNLPTAGYAYLEFELDSWKKLSEHSAQSCLIDYPKNHKNEE